MGNATVHFAARAGCMNEQLSPVTQIFSSQRETELVIGEGITMKERR